MKVEIYHCGDSLFLNDRAPTDKLIYVIGSWEQFIELTTKPYPPQIRYRVEFSELEKEAWHQYSDKCVEIVGPKRALISAIEGGMVVGKTYWAGSQGTNDFGYYAVVVE